MNVLFSDLDNTLIYSHRIMIQGEKIPVEQLNGKDQSYMTAETFSFLRKLDWICFVPVTTRSESQFRRLTLPEMPNASCAILCNGGKLLIRGAEDPEWTAETMEQVRNDIPELRELAGQLRELSGCEPHAPEIYYYYIGTDDPESICGELRSRNPDSRILIEHDRRKVYLFPPDVNKGEAVRRLVRRLRPNLTVGAGDSGMDVPMLNETDYALAAGRICGLIHRPKVCPLAGDVISDGICETLAEMHRNKLL